MPIEIRTIQTDAEAVRHGFISAYAFNGDRSDEALARRASCYPRDWCLGAFEDGALVAGLVVIPFEQYINGGKLALGGIASVSCLPEKRRGGFVSALLRQAMVSMRANGQPMSGLYTPHYSLYRRFGWEISHRIMSYSFAPKTMRTRVPAPEGRWRRAGAEEWESVRRLYDEHHATRNGGFARGEHRWRTQVFSDGGKGSRDAAIWSNTAGVDRAYVVYGTHTRPAPGQPFPETVLRVHDWAALDPDGYSAVLNYLLSHDLSNTILMLASPDEPLAEAFEEPTHLKEPHGAWFGMMTRIVDLPAALAARPALPQASGRGCTVAIADSSAPWNTGRWRIESGEGRIAAEATTSRPEIEMDVRALAPIFNGYAKPADLARVGTIVVHDERALDAMTDVFSVAYSPYCADDF